jgi:hypothetical protein
MRCAQFDFFGTSPSVRFPSRIDLLNSTSFTESLNSAIVWLSTSGSMPSAIARSSIVRATTGAPVL